jgi:hypothetical protein
MAQPKKKDMVTQGSSKSAKKAKRPLLPRLTLTTQQGNMMELIFDYLNGKLTDRFSSREGKRRAADAVSGFWYPFALIESGAAPSDVKSAAQNAILVMQRQIQRIADAAGLDILTLEPTREPRDSDQQADIERIARMMEQIIANQNGNGAAATVAVSNLSPHAAVQQSESLSPFALSEGELGYIIVDEEELLGDLL